MPNEVAVKTSPAKAIVGASVAILTAIGAGLTDGNLTAAELVTAAVAGLVSFSGVYWTTNKPV